MAIESNALQQVKATPLAAGRAHKIVKVWNRSDKDHTEEYNGESITIPAGEFIMMPWVKGVKFAGQYWKGAFKNGRGEWLNEKKIEVENPPTDDVTPEQAKKQAEGFCTICNKQLKGKRGLQLHNENVHPNAEHFKDDE